MAKDTTPDTVGQQAESSALKRLRAARRKPTQIGTAVGCLDELRATLDREFDAARDETGTLAYIRELVDRAVGLARIGNIF